MLQNKLTFNQSSVSLELSGLPDYSKNDKDDSISIISNWKLSILNQPEIEGGVDHLKSIIRAFYNYSVCILLDQDDKLSSNLIDINLRKDGKHNVLLKSTKANVDPLCLTIGNAELSDIINCFDQLHDSDLINLDFKELGPVYKKKRFNVLKSKKIIAALIPPLIALCSLSFVSSISIFFYKNNLEKDDISYLVINKTSNHLFDVIRID